MEFNPKSRLSASKGGSGRLSIGGEDRNAKLDAVPEASSSPRTSGKYKKSTTTTSAATSSLSRNSSLRASVETLPKFSATSGTR